MSSAVILISEANPGTLLAQELTLLYRLGNCNNSNLPPSAHVSFGASSKVWTGDDSQFVILGLAVIGRAISEPADSRGQSFVSSENDFVAVSFRTIFAGGGIHRQRLCQIALVERLLSCKLYNLSLLVIVFPAKFDGLALRYGDGLCERRLF